MYLYNKSVYFFNKSTIASIKGKGHNLKKHLRVLIAGTGARDLPGVYCHCIRNVYDLKGVTNKKKRRSIYGVKKKSIL